MSNDDLYHSVPILDGSNYTLWAQGMTAALRSKGVWQVVRGHQIRPENLGGDADDDDIAARQKEKDDWDNRDDQALGLMQLKMAKSLHHHITDTITSSELWDLLKGTYGTSGPARVFADFKKTISFRISGNGHPAPEVNKLQNLIDQLRLDGVLLDPFIQSMILLSAIPSKWDTVPATILGTKKKEELTFTLVRDALITEYDRKNTNVNSGSTAKRISNIKRKGPDPQYRAAPRQLPPSEASTSKEGENKKKKTRRGKSFGRGKAKEGEYVTFASPAIHQREKPSPPQPMTYTMVNGHGTVTTHTIKPPQAYIVGEISVPPPVYPDVTASRKMADILGVRKNISNLSQLESLSTKRKAVDYPLGDQPRKNSPPPEKVARVRDEDEISLDWGSDVDDDIVMAAGLSPRETPRYGSILPKSHVPNMFCQRLLTAEVDSRQNNKNTNSFCFLFDVTSSLRRIEEHKGKCETCQFLHVSDEWVMDSGASLHFTGDRNDFTYFQDGDFGESETANGLAKITGKGVIFIKHTVELEDGSEYEKVSRLEPVYYMPKLTIRLLSMGTLLQQDLEMTGSSSRLIFKEKETQEVFMTCVPHHHGQTIYWVKSKIVKPQQVKASIKYEELHRRFGHPSEEVLRKVPLHTKGFDKLIVPKERSVCPGCAQGKMHQKSFPESQTRATKKFQIIHSDLKEFPMLSYHKFKYYMSFVDDYSSHTWVTKLKKKSDAFDSFQKWIKLVKNQYGDDCHIKIWHADGGGEYITKKFTEVFEDLGIIVFRSAPHTPQQNGRAERFNRTIMDKAESMRHLAGFPGSWWEFAVDQAVHIYNRTPMQRLNWQTPYELMHGEIPNISHIRVLGCGAYVWLPEAKRRNKLSPKSELMIYIGIADGIKGYKFMRLHNNTIFVGTTAQFIEDYFPRKDREYRNDPDRPIEDNGNDNSQPFSPTPSNKEAEKEIDDGQQPSQPASTPPEKLDHPIRRSIREKRKPNKSDNINGDRNPTDIDSNVDNDRFWKEVIEAEKDSNHSPSDPSVGNNNKESGPNPTPNTSSDDQNQQQDISDDDLTRIVKEGGEELINLLLMRADKYDENIPQQFRDILRFSKEQKDEWIKACKEEIEALRNRHVFDLVDLPSNKKPIANRWVFDIKADGRKRARLVAKGFQQKEGIDYNAIFSPVIRYETVHLMFALGALENWHFEALDVKTAFLYGTLDEEVYMKQPEGFVIRGKENKVLRLKKAIYGLKQASHSWWEELKTSMSQLGFKHTQSDAGVFARNYKNGDKIIVIVYVDDALFASSNKKLALEAKSQFMKKWECRDLGEAKEFLGMKIRQDGKTISLSQTQYLKQVLERFRMQNCKFAKTPLPTGWRATENHEKATPEFRLRYQAIIGSLLYLMIGTRPDIAFAVTRLAQYAANPSKEHMDKALYVCKYLAGTIDYELVFDGNSNKGLLAYCDSDYAGCTDTRRSITGYLVKIADGIICWQSHAQKTVALSSTEAEYMALSDCSRQIVWLQSLLGELGFSHTRTPIYGDNQGSMFIGSNPVQDRRTKHIDIRYHFIREKIVEGKVEVFFIQGDKNIADMFTKNLGNIKFKEFRSQLGIRFHSHTLEHSSPDTVLSEEVC